MEGKLWRGASSACAPLLPAPSTPLLFLLSRTRRRRPRLALTVKLAPASASSYNGWADLAAVEPDIPLALPLRPPLLLLLLPAAVAVALSLSRLPLLATAFAAGFAARHLCSPPPPVRLDASLPEAEPILIQAVDRLRDAVLDAAQSNSDTREVAECLRVWARQAVRGLRLSAAPNTTPHAGVSGKANKPTAAAPAPQEDANPGLHSTRAPESALHMLPFHNDADAPEVTSANSKLGGDDGQLERLLFKHRHGRPFPSTESSVLERTLEIRDRSYRLNISETQASESQETGKYAAAASAAAGLDPPYNETASRDSDGEEFSHSVKEAAEILKKARECMMAGADEETADALLYNAARLLSTAVALRPASLVAVGQLGNVYLLHGELKLKLSRELRTLLASCGTSLNRRESTSRSRKIDTRILSRENISSALVDVCEECESLLVEAGRSYRTALSIDPDDVKALYNWGLALIFRAQLLADIGPEAAVDADRVYLAAIDKFDAMLSKSNTYAPEALYRWGTALQQRSQLRPRNRKEKIRLLEQAKGLFEDVLYVEADNRVVREALSSCISELNYHGRWL